MTKRIFSLAILMSGIMFLCGCTSLPTVNYTVAPVIPTEVPTNTPEPVVSAETQKRLAAKINSLQAQEEAEQSKCASLHTQALTAADNLCDAQVKAAKGTYNAGDMIKAAKEARNNTESRLADEYGNRSRAIAARYKALTDKAYADEKVTQPVDTAEH